MAEKLLEIKDLEVLYKSGKNPVHAVNGISLTLNKGETLGLVGETGAGKTTTALAILRLLPERTGCINQGQILFEDRDLLTLSEEEMRTQIRGEKISMIFQDPMTSLNPVATVGDQIAEAIIYHSNGQKVSQEQIDRRVGEVLEMVGIPAAAVLPAATSPAKAARAPISPCANADPTTMWHVAALANKPVYSTQNSA